MSLPPGVGDESWKLMRRRIEGPSIANHPARHQIAIAVVVDGDGFCRCVRDTLELDLPGVRGLAAAVTGAELRVAFCQGRLRLGARTAGAAGGVCGLRRAMP